MTIEEKFNIAETKIRQPRFLENRGMGNEVVYYIFDYDPPPPPGSGPEECIR